MLSFDHSAKIAEAMLFQPNGNPDEKAFSAVLSARFPDGSSEAEMTRFVAAVGGTCAEEPTNITTFCGGTPETRPPQCATQVNDALRCQIPISGTFCVSNRIGIQAHLSSAKTISNITTRRSDVMC